jgi:hypothetical protein
MAQRTAQDAARAAADAVTPCPKYGAASRAVAAARNTGVSRGLSPRRWPKWHVACVSLYAKGVSAAPTDVADVASRRCYGTRVLSCPPMLRRGMLIVAVALGAVPGIATAKLMLRLNVAVPKQLTTHTPITVSGDVNGELGAEFVAVFFSKDRCVRKYASENRLSANATGTGVGYLTDQDEQGTVQHDRHAREARQARPLAVRVRISLRPHGRHHGHRPARREEAPLTRPSRPPARATRRRAPRTPAGDR